MKKIFLSLLAVGSLMNLLAQNEYKKTPSVGIHFFYNDFQTAQELRTQGIANVIRDKNWKKTSRMSAGLAVSYIKGITETVDFITTASGSFLEYPVPTTSVDVSSRFLLDVTAVTNVKLLSDKYTFTPYLSAGLGVSKFGGYYGAFIPAGVGLQFNIFDEAFLLINSQYRIPVTENVAYHLYHSIGFAGNVVKRKVIEPAPLPEPPVVDPK